ARRFLKQVFENNTVLFVGYSHNDTVMKYLARGLPPNKNHRRFVFTGEYDKQEHWEHLGITAIKYPQESESDHKSLNDAIRGWVNMNAKGALDIEKTISEIVSSPTELNKTNKSRLRRYLSK